MHKDGAKTDKLKFVSHGSRWNLFLVIIDISAIALYFVLQWLELSFHFLPLQIVIVVAGTPLVFEIFKKVVHGDFGADMLAAIAVVVAAYLGAYLAAALVILMLSGGQALEEYAMRKASSVLLALASRMPSIAHCERDGIIYDIQLMDVKIGDVIFVYPHEVVPVDGTVITGHSSMDEAYLTGEPYRVSKAPGSSVISGAINGESALVIKAERLPSDSRYAKIMEVMQEAEQKRPVMRRLGDQLGALFAPLALLVAGVAWYISGDVMRFLAVLVIATPCPLLIAIPITIISAISIAAKHGIIIKDPTVLERIPTCRTAIFDKTGTLTYGEPALTDIIIAADMDRNTILAEVASLERYSKHPMASAVIKAANLARLKIPYASEVSELPGQGVYGIIEGYKIQITHRSKLEKDNPAIAKLLPKIAAGLECVILRNGEYAATFRFHDEIRGDTHSFISHLIPSHQFNKIMLVSGDRESEVHYLADLLGIENTLASQTPEQKLEIVRAETLKAPTLFMGDGINDAPALTAATVGIAFGQNTNVTAEAAGAVIMDSTLYKVDQLIHLSVSMRSIVLQSAIGGMALSFVGMGFAAAGYISPVAGALIQEAIDVIAILNALRLIWESEIKSDINKPIVH